MQDYDVIGYDPAGAELFAVWRSAATTPNASQSNLRRTVP
jgi:hypothetical protein